MPARIQREESAMTTTISPTPRPRGVPSEETIYTVGDFVRRVVGSLLQGRYRGTFLCSSCLIKLARGQLDKSYSLVEIDWAMDDIFKAPGALTLLPTAVCALCARKKAMPCLGVPLS
jgi:hypothetical protein